MKTIEYKGQSYKCEITHRDSNAIRVRVYDKDNVGNLYILTKGYAMPRPYQYNRSNLIVKNVVLLAFKELLKPDVEPEIVVVEPEVVVEEPVKTMPGRRSRNVVADRF